MDIFYDCFQQIQIIIIQVTQNKKMDEAQIMREIQQQKVQNPRLKKIPLNLGQKFLDLSKPGSEIQLPQPLKKYPVLLLLFGADWCNITKPFIKQVRKHYQQINLQSKNLQIIYISLDKSKKDFDSFANTMPWLGISFDDARVKGLKQFYNVRTIPNLILVDDQGEIVENDCRADVYRMKEDDVYEKWRKLKDIAKDNFGEQEKKQ